MPPALAPEPPPSSLRTLALVVGAVETLALVVFASIMLPSSSSDPLGSTIGQGVTMLLALPYVALVVPGLFLAWTYRAPRAGLALVLLAIPVAAVLWQNA